MFAVSIISRLTALIAALVILIVAVFAGHREVVGGADAGADDLADIRREYARLLVVGRIRHPAAVPNQREWDKIIERFLLAMAQPAEERTDPVFRDLPVDHAVYTKLLGEIADIHLLPAQDAASAILHIQRDIAAFLSAPQGVPSELTYWRDGDTYGVSERGTIKFSRTLSRERSACLLRLASRDPAADAVAQIVKCVLRYECLALGGQQMCFPKAWYALLYNEFGVRIEGFASPFNSQLMLIAAPTGQPFHFCSLFPDTDRPFGSIGDFGALDRAALTRLAGAPGKWPPIAINPPFIEAIMSAAVDRIADWLAAPIAERGPQFHVFAGFPAWSDSDYYIKAGCLVEGDSTGRSLFRVLGRGDFFYENIIGPRVADVWNVASHLVCIFVPRDAEVAWTPAEAHRRVLGAMKLKSTAS